MVTAQQLSIAGLRREAEAQRLGVPCRQLVAPTGSFGVHLIVGAAMVGYIEAMLIMRTF